MRACATANAVFAGLFLGVMSFAACSGGQEPTPGTMGALRPQTPGTPAAPGEAATGAPAPNGGAATTPSAAVSANAAMTAPRSDLVNEPPDGGVVLDNAMMIGDGGTSDRLQPLIDVIKAHRDGFRRCFDARANAGPDAKGRVVMLFNLTPEGELQVAGIDPGLSTYTASDVTGCMITFAKSLTYPASPHGKFTRFRYPFDFKAR